MERRKNVADIFLDATSHKTIFGWFESELTTHALHQGNLDILYNLTLEKLELCFNEMQADSGSSGTAHSGLGLWPLGTNYQVCVSFYSM